LEPILDQKNTNNSIKIKPFKNVSLLLIGASILVILYVFLFVYYQKEKSINPYLPDFTAIYIYHELINFAIIQCFSLLPVVFLHSKKLYKLAIITMLLLTSCSWFIRNSIDFYLWFY
jgi:hypothetical protein